MSAHPDGPLRSRSHPARAVHRNVPSAGPAHGAGHEAANGIRFCHSLCALPLQFLDPILRLVVAFHQPVIPGKVVALIQSRGTVLIDTALGQLGHHIQLFKKLPHPEEHKAMQEKLSLARNSPEARKKRSESLKAWAEDNPEAAKANAKKRSAASVAKSSKPVNMCDLETGEVIRTFTSQHEAAQWLVDNSLAKNTNCVSSINGVCQRKPCTTGYGYRKKPMDMTGSTRKKSLRPQIERLPSVRTIPLKLNNTPL